MMKDTISDTEWLTPGEAAELLNVHISTIYRWGEKDKIKLYQVGKRTRLNRAEIEILANEIRKTGEKTADTIYQQLSTLSIFALEVESISLKLDGQPEYRCHLAVLLPIVVRSWRKSPKRPPKAPISAVKALLDRLQKHVPTFFDVTECTDKLEAAGIRTLPESPALADALIEWADEGFPGREYGDNIF